MKEEEPVELGTKIESMTALQLTLFLSNFLSMEDARTLVCELVKHQRETKGN